jgi:hypothetical protein
VRGLADALDEIEPEYSGRSESRLSSPFGSAAFPSARGRDWCQRMLGKVAPAVCRVSLLKRTTFLALAESSIRASALYLSAPWSPFSARYGDLTADFPAEPSGGLGGFNVTQQVEGDNGLVLELSGTR